MLSFTVKALWTLSLSAQIRPSKSQAITLTVLSKLLLLVIASLFPTSTTAKLNSALGGLISSPGTVSMDCLEKSQCSPGSVR